MEMFEDRTHGRIDFHLPVIRPLDLDQPEAELLQMIAALPSNVRI
jgi:hypothetical protein